MYFLIPALSLLLCSLIPGDIDANHISIIKQGAKFNPYFNHPDHLSSSAYITDRDGYGFQHYEYLPYGEDWEQVAPKNSDFNRHKYTGQEKDDGTDLYYYNARYYDHDLGLFTQVDPPMLEPNGYLAGNGNQGVFNHSNLNSYLYVTGNPIKYNDPTGRWFWLIPIGFRALEWG